MSAVEMLQSKFGAAATEFRGQRRAVVEPGKLYAALEALKATIAGISGDNVLSNLPKIANDLQRIDTAWTALQQQIDRDCS